MSEAPSVPPIGWQSAVAMLRAGVPKASVLHGLQRELGLPTHDAADALAFAIEWLQDARSP